MAEVQKKEFVCTGRSSRDVWLLRLCLRPVFPVFDLFLIAFLYFFCFFLLSFADAFQDADEGKC